MDENTKTADETSGGRKADAGGKTASAAKRRIHRKTDKANFITDDNGTGEYEYWFYKCLEEFNDPDK